MKRILADGRVLIHEHITGVERYTIEILERLKSKRNIDVAVPFYGNKMFQHMWEHFILPNLAKEYDVLFCPSNMSPFFKPKWLKFVVTIHDVSFLNYPDSFSFEYRNYYKLFTKAVIRNADKIITVSNFEKWELMFRYDIEPRKIDYIYSGVDKDFLESEIIERKDDYILYVGNLSKRKNFHGLIKAYSMIYKNIDKKLVVVGMKPDIMKIDKSLDYVLKSIPRDYIEFKGHINEKEELKKLYRHASAFIFPSLYESFGFPPLEAMACGTPVVVSNVTAMPEICGDAAIYVDPFSVESICGGIMKVLSDVDLRKKLIMRGKRRASEFSWDKSVEKHIKVLESVI